MHRTPKEWAGVSAYAATSGSQAQAENVLRMALDDIAALAAVARPVLSILEAVRYTAGLGKTQLERIERLRSALGERPASAPAAQDVSRERK